MPEYKPRKSILVQQDRRRSRKLDISGKRSKAYRKRTLSLIHRARIAAGVRKYYKFRHSKKDYTKRRS